MSPTATKSIFGVFPEGTCLTPGSCTILDLSWKVIYWHMWRQTLDGIHLTQDGVIASIVERLNQRIKGFRSLMIRRGNTNNNRRNRSKALNSYPILLKFCREERRLTLHPGIIECLGAHGWPPDGH